MLTFSETSVEKARASQQAQQNAQQRNPNRLDVKALSTVSQPPVPSSDQERFAADDSLQTPVYPSFQDTLPTPVNASSYWDNEYKLLALRPGWKAKSPSDGSSSSSAYDQFQEPITPFDAFPGQPFLQKQYANFVDFGQIQSASAAASASAIAAPADEASTMPDMRDWYAALRSESIGDDGSLGAPLQYPGQWQLPVAMPVPFAAPTQPVSSADGNFLHPYPINTASGHDHRSAARYDPLAYKTPRPMAPSRSTSSSASLCSDADDDDWSSHYNSDATTSSTTRSDRSAQKVSSSAKGKRQQRNIVYHPGTSIRNRNHIFVVHTQDKSSPEVTHLSVRVLILVTNANLPLVRAACSLEYYTPESEAEDRRSCNSYDFVDVPSNRMWTLSFDQNGSTMTPGPPVEDDGTNEFRTHDFAEGSIHTFVHFPPNSMVVSDEHAIGSRAWWRNQECEGNHGSKYPAGGIWSAKFDDPESGEPRRPARIVGHFASCKHHAKEGDWFPLGKLARAVKTPVQRAAPNNAGAATRRRPSTGDQ